MVLILLGGPPRLSLLGSMWYAVIGSELSETSCELISVVLLLSSFSHPANIYGALTMQGLVK